MRKYVLAAAMAGIIGMVGFGSVAQAPASPRPAPLLHDVTVVHLQRAYLAQLRHVKPGEKAGIEYPLGTRIKPVARQRAGCKEPNCPLSYLGGRVQHHPHVYLLLWGPNWASDPAQAATASFMQKLYAGLGALPADSWSATNAQYADATGFPSFDEPVYQGAFTDPSAPPKGVTSAQVAARANAFAVTQHITDRIDAQIVVATQSGTCPQGFAAPKCGTTAGACAYHAYSAEPYTNLPYILDAGKRCGQNFVNPGADGLNDGLSMIIGHEYAETITDPKPFTGWADPNDKITDGGAPGEIGDKCQLGGKLWGSHDPYGNVTLSTGTFAMQSLWSNVDGGCVMAPRGAIAGIPAAFKVVKSSTAPCKWKVTGLPTSVTHGTSSSVNRDCTMLIDGVWPAPGAFSVVAKVTTAGATTTYPLTVPVAPAPSVSDAVGVGADASTPLTDQLSTDYNLTVPGLAPHEYSWDGVNPVTGQAGDLIQEKAACPAITRPDGSSAGINALATFTKDTSGTYYCTSFARSARPRSPADPPYAAGGVAFANLAGDAVSWATPAVNTAAPASLTPAQLNAIYSCTVGNWSQVGGANQAIAPFLPETGSDAAAVFLAAIGVPQPGSCVSDGNNTLPENEGVNPVLNNPGAIFPYSVGDWIAQAFHSDTCENAACTANASGVVCVHTPAKNSFGCDVHGTMTPRQISGVPPTAGNGDHTTINPAFAASFQYTLFNVVPYDPATADHIPGAAKPVGGVNLGRIFGGAGFDCRSSTARADIRSYGFLVLTACGRTS